MLCFSDNFFFLHIKHFFQKWILLQLYYIFWPFLHYLDGFGTFCLTFWHYKNRNNMIVFCTNIRMKQPPISITLSEKLDTGSLKTRGKSLFALWLTIKDWHSVQVLFLLNSFTCLSMAVLNNIFKNINDSLNYSKSRLKNSPGHIAPV